MYLKRAAVVLAGAAVTVLLSSTAASAHECFIASRSDQGNASATHSSRWVALTIAQIATFTPPGTDHACFIAYWTSHGGPASLTVRSDKVIGESSNNPNLANGKGLDHAADVFGGLLVAAVTACSA